MNRLHSARHVLAYRARHDDNGSDLLGSVVLIEDNAEDDRGYLIIFDRVGFV